MTKIDQTYQQIASYLSGNLPKEEAAEFETWLSAASKEEKALFEATRKLWEKAADEEITTFKPDVDRALEQMAIKRQFRKQPKHSSWRIAAVISTLVAAAVTLFFLSKDSSEITKLAQNEIEKVELPDGSAIWLSPGSTITYPDQFKKNREVHLSGKAFFEVAKMNGQPFTVFAANTKTQVLGTSFNLESGDDGQVAIQVTTGKVAFSEIDKAEPIYLTPGNQAKYLPKRTEKIQTDKIENENYRAWQTKIITFQNTSVNTVFETLGEYYQTHFEVSEELSKCRFTTSFENQKLQEVLEILEITGNLTITQTTNGYQITGPACN